MGRKGSAQGGHSAGGKPAFGGSGPYRLEGLLGPRVEDYVKAQHGDIDVDELVEYLRCAAGATAAGAQLRRGVSADARRSLSRSTFREYQRKQVNALRKARALSPRGAAVG